MITFGNPASSYKIIRALGRGVQAQAYLCRADGRDFVIRVAEHTTPFEGRFYRTATNWGRPALGISPPFDTVAILQDGTPRVAHVSAYRGTSVRQILARGPIRDHAALARLHADLGGGIATMAAMGFYHLDLGPSNVLVDAAGEAWICDFGNVTPIDEFKPELHLDRGRYNAPLTYARNPDYFSLGLILFEAAVGEHLIVPYSESRALRDIVRETREKLKNFFTSEGAMQARYTDKLRDVPECVREPIRRYLSP